jgi:hypothetical protein
VLDYFFNMTKEELKEITELQKDLKNLPNTNLVQLMDKLSLEFEETKEMLIKYTYYLDNIEIMYNNVLKEYQERNK